MKDKKKEKIDLTNTASIAGNSCHPAEVDAEDTVTRPANKQLTERETKPERDAVVTLTNARGNTGTRYGGLCVYCGKPFTAKRRTKKYCSNVCCVYAYHERQGGRKCKVCDQPTPSPNRSVCSDTCRATLPHYRGNHDSS